MVGYETYVEARAAHIDGDDVAQSGSARDQPARDDAAAGAREQEIDRRAGSALGRGDAAVGLHDPGANPRIPLFDPLAQAGEVGGADGFEIGVEHRGRCAFVFAYLRHHLARQRDRQSGRRVTDDLGRAAFMGIVEVRVQETDGDTGDSAREDPADRVAHRFLVEFGHHRAVVAQSFGHLESVPAGDEWGGAGVEQVVEAVGGPGEASDLQHVAESARGEQRDAWAVALEAQIRTDGRAVYEVSNASGRSLRRQLDDTLGRGQDRSRRVAAARGHLRAADESCFFVPEDCVGECATRVDTDAFHVVPFVQIDQNSI